MNNIHAGSETMQASCRFLENKPHITVLRKEHVTTMTPTIKPMNLHQRAALARAHALEQMSRFIAKPHTDLEQQFYRHRPQPKHEGSWQLNAWALVAIVVITFCLVLAFSGRG